MQWNNQTFVPFEGKIGNEAKAQWKKYNKLRPDYKIYTKRLETIEKSNKQFEEKMKDKDQVIAQQANEISKNSVEQKKLELEIEKFKKSKINPSKGKLWISVLSIGLFGVAL